MQQQNVIILQFFTFGPDLTEIARFQELPALKTRKLPTRCLPSLLQLMQASASLPLPQDDFLQVLEGKRTLIERFIVELL